MTPERRAREYVEAMWDEGVPALAVYLDDEGWHMAAPGAHWADLAKGLRTLAEECEKQAAEADKRTLN